MRYELIYNVFNLLIIFFKSKIKITLANTILCHSNIFAASVMSWRKFGRNRCTVENVTRGEYYYSNSYTLRHTCLNLTWIINYLSRKVFGTNRSIIMYSIYNMIFRITSNIIMGYLISCIVKRLHVL